MIPCNRDAVGHLMHEHNLVIEAGNCLAMANTALQSKTCSSLQIQLKKRANA